MLILTGTNGAGKTTVYNYLKTRIDLEYHKLASYLSKGTTVDEYRKNLKELLSKPSIIEAGLDEIFAIQLLELPCYVILVVCDEDIKYERLSKRNKVDIKSIKDKFGAIFRNLEKLQSVIKADLILTTDELENLDVKEIKEKLTLLREKVNGH